MTLYCQLLGAVLLWAITLPVGTIAPQGGEVRIKVCHIGQNALVIEKQFYIFEQPAGTRTDEFVCWRDGTARQGYGCRHAEADSSTIPDMIQP